MSTPSIKVGQGNWGIKAGNLLAYANTEKKFSPVEFTSTRALNTATRVNASGNIEGVNANVPRIDYFGGQASFLVEPAATNNIRNNSMVGAVAPNTLPNNWSNSGSNLTRQSVVTGTLNGIPYVDVRVSGTASSTFHDIFWDASNIIVASVGQNWVASCYLQIIAQPNPPVNYILAMREFSSGSTFLGVFQGSALSISTTSFNRFSFTRALNQATVAFVHPSLFFTLVNGQTYDFTIRIGYPQMELGSVATSVIPTTTGSVTRNADVISLTGVAGLIGQTEGVLYIECESNDGLDDVFFINRSVSNGIALYKNANNAYLGRIFHSSNSIIFTSASGVTGTVKIAIAYKSGDSTMYLNGSRVGNLDTTAITFGAALNSLVTDKSAGFINGIKPSRIRAVALYTTRLTDAELAALTSP